jgi:quinolinate synthase
MTSTAFSAAVHPGEAFIDVAFDQPQAAEPTAAVCGTGHAWARIPREPAPDEREALKARVRELLKEKNAVLVSHYYVHPDLQDLAMETGGIVSDSLEMARFGRDLCSTMS